MYIFATQTQMNLDAQILLKGVFIAKGVFYIFLVFVLHEMVV